jgi:hypothetical protein
VRLGEGLRKGRKRLRERLREAEARERLGGARRGNGGG